jgi:hypothetical protein
MTTYQCHIFAVAERGQRIATLQKTAIEVSDASRGQGLEWYADTFGILVIVFPLTVADFRVWKRGRLFGDRVYEI